ncbi:FHA domain-containing protein [Extensimonas vulgaris]|uniref:FHA domain-containing protein n=1 Tax=Extensimonas vulgaris TaxID=1031594 RepID=A0A369ALW7_9BURK|nr:FHA domain-containing protein [Extensimonas vulgaris]RCX10161.1 FHA domain-containing protein [Extensimonas vulgaris]TWI39742.1 FHA domain-containing protein [Extensimonas vulgaris]TXD17307.1 FHA domain-containing protein [Extensimonas vulgaris]
MPRLIISIDGLVTREVPLTQAHTTLGRRPYNDIVIDNLAVSGEHAALHMHDGEVEIEDLGSTNGTYVNGKPVRRRVLQHGDKIIVGKYLLRFVDEQALAHATRNSAHAPLTAVPSAAHPQVPPPPPPPMLPLVANIRILSGPTAGREMVLQKVVTTIGKPGVAVASITRRTQGFMLAHVDGAEMPRLNGTPISVDTPILLHDGDQIELAGTQMVFEQH